MSWRAGRNANPLGAAGRETSKPKFSRNAVAKLKLKTPPGKLLASRARSRKRYVNFLLVEKDNLRALADELDAEGWSFDGERWTEEKLLKLRRGVRKSK